MGSGEICCSSRLQALVELSEGCGTSLMTPPTPAIAGGVPNQLGADR